MGIVQDAFVLDTSAYSNFYRGNERLRPWFDAKYTIYVPLIVIAELRAGFLGGSKPEENEQDLIRFLDAGNVEILPLSLKTTTCFSQLQALLRKAGTPIPTNDLWISALALEHNLPILTLDADFKRVPNVLVVAL